MSEPETLTASQVAEMCGVTARTVNRWVRAGYFAGATRAPGRTSPYRIPKDEVESFIAQMSERVALHYRDRPLAGLQEHLSQPDQRAVLAALAETLQQLEEQQLHKRMPVALVVEDDVDAGDIFEFTLKTAGFTPAVVRSGETALKWLASLTPDILVLDLHLPDVPGTEILQRLRADSRLETVPVIVVTAHTELAESVEHEVELVLIKPVRYEELQDSATELAGE
jgi:excisionase family DNA binding protein